MGKARTISKTKRLADRVGQTLENLKRVQAERAKREAAEDGVLASIRQPRYCVGVKSETTDGGYYGDALTRFVCHDKASLLQVLKGFARGVEATDDDLDGGVVFVLRRRKVG